MLYYTAKTYQELKDELAAQERQALEDHILEAHYNTFCSNHADARTDAVRSRHGGKNIPYVGWFWRNVPWSRLDRITIGDCGEFIGFMMSNKWDYPQRWLTAEEGERVVAILDAAIQANGQGGSLETMEQGREAKLQELWDYIQTLKVERSKDD